MGIFEGTIKEFTRFIGPYARGRVAQIASKHKKSLGKCEECNGIGPLDAAHVKGKERPFLISNILAEFMENDIVRIDLAVFEERFVNAHLPIETTIRALCKPCHREYDRKVKEKQPNSKNLHLTEEQIIESLVTSGMNKSKALKILMGKGYKSITNSNTIFSNLVFAQTSWWLQPENSKFKTDLNIILNDKEKSLLYFFSLPAGTIQDPAAHFKQRNDKYRTDCSDIYIPADGIEFKEKNGFDFSGFLVEKIGY